MRLFFPAAGFLDLERTGDLMNWLSFGIGLMLGGMLGVFVMCLCFVSGEASRREEQLEQQLRTRNE